VDGFVSWEHVASKQLNALGMQSLQVSEIQVAQRPKEPANQGKAVKLATNFFKANFDRVPPLMHHDCRVEKLRYDPETRAFTHNI
jgi:hypothetical protein